jgi:hypothetical protein
MFKKKDKCTFEGVKFYLKMPQKRRNKILISKKKK